MRRCLRDPTFSRFDTIPECDRHTHTQTHRHTTTANTALSIASRGKNGRLSAGSETVGELRITRVANRWRKVQEYRKISRRHIDLYEVVGERQGVNSGDKVKKHSIRL